jgi:hypothetical protein
MMAMSNAVSSPISSPKPSLAAIDVSYLAIALGFLENDLRTLLTAPNAELANKFRHQHRPKSELQTNLNRKSVTIRPKARSFLPS